MMHQKVAHDKIIQTRYISLTHQVTDILTKALENTRADFIYDKLDLYDVYALT